MLKALQGVLSPAGFPYGSNGRLFRDAEFGRDALETAEDLMEIRPDIARVVIRRLAALQGVVAHPKTGEEPGKIHHEHRALVVAGRPVAEESARIFRDLARGWQLAETEDDLRALTTLINYYSVDATALYVRLVARFMVRYGPAILEETYQPHRPIDGIDRPTIRHSVEAAVEWIADRVERSDLGLLEWQRLNPREHRFQAWKDGSTSYLHEDASFGNYTAAMASIEVQGLAYDALIAAGPLLDLDARSAKRYGALAQAIQQTTLQRFWMPDRQYFAMALDRDPLSGEVRQLRLLTSNAGALLDSAIFDSLEPEERIRYVVPVVERLFGEEFLTPVGIRTSSLLHKDLQDYHAYHSSYTIWHKETYDIAKGLRRQGLPGLAEELEHRMLNSVNLAGPREFLYVLPDNRVGCGPVEGLPTSQIVEIRGTNVPEQDQTWTIAAALAVKWRVGRRRQSPSRPAQQYAGLEGDLLRRVGKTPLFRTLAEIKRARPANYAFHVDTRKGWEHERAWVRLHDLEGTQPPTP